MNIEIVGFYKNMDKKKKLYGTFHVYLIDQDIDIRGIPVFLKKKDYYIINLPDGWAIDEDTKIKVRFPIFSFANNDTHKLFMKTLREKCLHYLKNNV